MLSGQPLTRARVEEALRALGELLDRRGVVGEVLVFGGAAMILAYDARPATRDIDAVFQPDDEVRSAADEVAVRMGLARHWLNNQASSYLSRKAAEARVQAFEAPGIRVFTLAPEHLLAMKVLAGRPAQDATDIKLLASHLGLRTSAEVIALVQRIFPDEVLRPQAKLLIEDLLGESDQRT